MGLAAPRSTPFQPPPATPLCFCSPLSESARLLGKAGVSGPVGSPSRVLHSPMRTDPRRVLREPCIRGKSFDKPPAGKETFGPKEKGGRNRAARSYPRGQEPEGSAGWDGRRREKQREPSLCGTGTARLNVPRASNARFSTRDNSPRSPARRDAQGLPRPHSPTPEAPRLDRRRASRREITRSAVRRGVVRKG